MRNMLALPLIAIAAACAGEPEARSDRIAAGMPSEERSATGPSIPPPPEAPPPGSLQSGFAPPRVPADPVLSRMLAAIAPFQAHQQPCIAKNPLRRNFSPEQNRRSKIIWSDSLELQRRIRAAHGSRILNMSPDVTLGADKARFLVRVTGHEPLPAYRLGGRVRDVPVVVGYGMPYSADQLQQMVTAAHDKLMSILPDANGWGVSNGFGLGALFVDVHSPTGQPPGNLTKLCERLIDAVRIPVLLTYQSGRMTNGMAGPGT